MKKSILWMKIALRAISWGFAPPSNLKYKPRSRLPLRGDIPSLPQPRVSGHVDVLGGGMSLGRHLALERHAHLEVSRKSQYRGIKIARQTAYPAEHEIMDATRISRQSIVTSMKERRALSGFLTFEHKISSGLSIW